MQAIKASRFTPHSTARFATLKIYRLEFMAETDQNATGTVAHGASLKIQQKENLYEAEYLGSGTFRFVKPKRKGAKTRQSRLKGATRGARK
jgi:hypothetical protein